MAGVYTHSLCAFESDTLLILYCIDVLCDVAIYIIHTCLQDTRMGGYVFK